MTKPLLGPTAILIALLLVVACNTGGKSPPNFVVIDGRARITAASLTSSRIAHTVVPIGPGELSMVVSGSARVLIEDDIALVIGGVSESIAVTNTAEIIDARTGLSEPLEFEITAPFGCEEPGETVLDVEIRFTPTGGEALPTVRGSVDVSCAQNLPTTTLERIVIKAPDRSVLADLPCGDSDTVPFNPSFLAEIIGGDPVPSGTWSAETVEGVEPAELMEFPDFPSQASVTVPDERPYRFAIVYTTDDEVCRVEASLP